MVVNRRRTTSRCLSARLLVLGDKHVGKSASIVRYTTGRFIQEYCESTNDWLYRHPTGFDAKRNVTTAVELLEQRDFQFNNTNRFFASSSNIDGSNESNKTNPNQSLATRVALDQQIDNELHDRQQLLNKLHWADAYIVIYAINDVASFNKAIKYLNLIANNINSPNDNKQPYDYSRSNSITSNISSSNSSSSSSSSGGSGGCNSNSNSSNNSNTYAISSKLFNRLSLNTGQGATGNRLLVSGSSGGCGCATNGTVRRPILLLANKKDLEQNGRQVPSKDGRMLAIRHQAMFAEVAVAESGEHLQNTISSLIEQIDPACLHIEHLNEQQVLDRRNSPSTIVHWKPSIGLSVGQQSNNSTPLWGNLVKSKPIGASLARSIQVATPEVHLITPLSQVAQSVVTKLARERNSTGETIRREQQPDSFELLGSQVSVDCAAPKASTYLNRYENLKSSFRRASMAIVHSRAMVKSIKATRISDSMVYTSSSRDLRRSSELISERVIAPEKSTKPHSYWLRNHSKSNNERSFSNSTSNSILNLLSGSNSINVARDERARRPLFRYKSRRKTVAFEHTKTNSLQENVELQADLGVGDRLKQNSGLEEKDVENTGGSLDQIKLASVRSTSSLCIHQSSRNSLDFLQEPKTILPSSAGSDRTCSNIPSSAQVHSEQSSRSALSRASTSGGSCEDDGDMYETSGTLEDGAQGNSKNPSLAAKKGFHLVRSVQNTLTNLTRSSNIQSQAAKRSFCNNLFKHPASNIISTKTMTPVVANFPKAQPINLISVIAVCK